MWTFNMIFERFGAIVCLVTALLAIKGFLRIKRTLRVHILVLVFICCCIPNVADKLFLFALYEISVYGTGLTRTILKQFPKT